jgi:hypothetical protein
MHLKARFVAAVLAVSVFGAMHAPAMEILYFARMALDDQADYVSSMVAASAQMLRATGHPDEAAKAIALFKDPSKNGGLNQLVKNMRALQEQNTMSQSVTNDRTTTYDVAWAMHVTLRSNGIEVPLKFLESTNRNFTPQLPLRQHASGG